MWRTGPIHKSGKELPHHGFHSAPHVLQFGVPNVSATYCLPPADIARLVEALTDLLGYEITPPEAPLPPCPFCGEDEPEARASERGATMFCTRCGAEGPWAATHDAARSAWRERTPILEEEKT